MQDRIVHVKSNRASEREPLAEEIFVTFDEGPVRGPCTNISTTGVHFIVDQVIRVRVNLGGREVEGQLVRVENHGNGRTGIAVRFDEDAGGGAAD